MKMKFINFKATLSDFSQSKTNGVSTIGSTIVNTTKESKIHRIDFKNEIFSLVFHQK